MKLTREQIETMEAGPEMNAAVAELMGVCHHNWTTKPGKQGQQCVKCGVLRCMVSPTHTPDYSTDIAAAWEVMEHAGLLDFERRGWNLFYDDGVWVIGDDKFLGIAIGKTAPLAICRAALLWALEQEGE